MRSSGSSSSINTRMSSGGREKKLMIVNAMPRFSIRQNGRGWMQLPMVVEGPSRISFSSIRIVAKENVLQVSEFEVNKV